MGLRLIQAYIPEVSKEAILGVLEEQTVLQTRWKVQDDINQVDLLVSTDHSGAILELLEKRFSHREGFQMIVLPVEAIIPRLEEPESPSPEEVKNSGKTSKVHREELYSDIEESTKLTPTYLAMIIISSIVAGIGILQGNVAVVIGAMVIAPLLGPNMALCLGTTLGDFNLARKSLVSLGCGTALAFFFSYLWGSLVDVGMGGECPSVEFGDVILALASGCAGVLAFTSGASSSLVGVMVAVALLPPLVSCGLFFGMGNTCLATGNGLIFITNIICINLSGTLTFLLQGVGPLYWWEKKRARKASIRAVCIWLLLLLVLISILIYS